MVIYLPMYNRGRKPGAKDVKPRKLRPTKSVEDRFWNHVSKTDWCWNWTGTLNENGYGLVSVRIGRDDWRHRLAHRVSADMAGMDIVGKAVLHRCDNPRCVRPDHLVPGTHADNVRDMDSKGRRGSLKGSKHGRAKLTEFQVQEIRRRRDSGERGIDLAREFGVSPSAIVWITKGKHWRHVAQ